MPGVQPAGEVAAHGRALQPVLETITSGTRGQPAEDGQAEGQQAVCRLITTEPGPLAPIHAQAFINTPYAS